VSDEEYVSRHALLHATYVNPLGLLSNLFSIALRSISSILHPPTGRNEGMATALIRSKARSSLSLGFSSAESATANGKHLVSAPS
jgi:hypothetical protein